MIKKEKLYFYGGNSKISSSPNESEFIEIFIAIKTH